MDKKKLIPAIWSVLPVFLILIPAVVFSQVQQVNLQRIDVTKLPEVHLYFTVMDEAGNCVLGLNENEIDIVLDSISQDVTKLESALEGGEYLAVVLLFDRSGSMKTALGQAKSAAFDFINRISREDKVAVISFDDRVRIDSELSKNRDQIREAISSINLGNDTAFYDAVQQAMVLLEKEKTNRQAVLVLSDGKDTRSTQNRAEVLMQIKERGIPIFAVGLGVQQNTQNLTEFTQATGGEFFQAAGPDDLLRLYQKIAQQLLNQYVLVFTSSFGQDEKWRDLTIRIRNPQTEDISVSREFLAVRGVGVSREIVSRLKRGLEQQNILLVILLGAGIGLALGILLLLLIRLVRPQGSLSLLLALGLLFSALALGAVFGLILSYMM